MDFNYQEVSVHLIRRANVDKKVGTQKQGEVKAGGICTDFMKEPVLLAANRWRCKQKIRALKVYENINLVNISTTTIKAAW